MRLHSIFFLFSNVVYFLHLSFFVAHFHWHITLELAIASLHVVATCFKYLLLCTVVLPPFVLLLLCPSFILLEFELSPYCILQVEGFEFGAFFLVTTNKIFFVKYFFFIVFFSIFSFLLQFYLVLYLIFVCFIV